QLGLLFGTGEFDGRNSVFSQNMSWSDADTPMGKELNPQKVFDALVAGGAVASDGSVDPNAEAEAARRKALDKSVLDSLKASTVALQNKLSANAKLELEKYLTGVRELETRIGSGVAGPAPGTACAPIMRPESTTDYNANPVARMGIMNDLIVM